MPACRYRRSMPAQTVRLPGRGTTSVRDTTGPPGAPTVVLLHGLGATAALNWPGAAAALSSSFRVVELDHRGHGRGLRSRRVFRLEDCADDVVALADVLGVDRIVAAGYSMGGPIALLAARRHPDRIAGLVLCATAARFTDAPTATPPMVTALATGLRLTPAPVRRQLSSSMVQYAGRRWEVPAGYVEEVRRHDPAAIVEAATAVRRFDARPWLGEIRAPAASIVTARDPIVPPARQLELARTLGAGVLYVDGDHHAAVRHPQRFLPVAGRGLPPRHPPGAGVGHRLLTGDRRRPAPPGGPLIGPVSRT